MLHTYTYSYLELEDLIVHRALLGVEDVEEHFLSFYWSFQLDVIPLLCMSEGQGILWSKSRGFAWIAEWIFVNEELVLVWSHVLGFANVSYRSDNVLFCF